MVYDNLTNIGPSSLFAEFSGDFPTIVVGEMFIDGQNTNRWCESKKPTDISIFEVAQKITTPQSLPLAPSCFRLYAMTSGEPLRFKDFNTCILSSKNLKNNMYFLCE